MTAFRKITSFNSAGAFREYLWEIGADFDMTQREKFSGESALNAKYEFQTALTGRNKIFSNRWAILPMEGWDCLRSGAPSELTERRWAKFAASGSKLFFGGEAAAVMMSGRANTRQMTMTPETAPAIRRLREKTLEVHRNLYGTGDDPFIGLQLTHSGRFSKPNDDRVPEPKTAYEHPLLDKKFRCGRENVLTDGEVENIIERFIGAARLAQEAGFDFVDIKSAHGYLGHEFLTAHDRPGKFGGSFENRTRFFREIVEGIKLNAQGMEIAVRLSLYDFIPFEKGPDGVGVPMKSEETPYRFAFGGNGTGVGIDLTETFAFIEMARSLGIRMICATAGSPYYNPHIQRPAAFAVADGYLPPEEPLLGVSRQIAAVRDVKKRFPDMTLIGSGYTYLQEFLPRVADYVVERGEADFVGIGRMALSYPEIITDSLNGRELDAKRICRTFGDCTNAPRAGMVSGCYPLDDYYKSRPEAVRLKELKSKGK